MISDHGQRVISDHIWRDLRSPELLLERAEAVDELIVQLAQLGAHRRLAVSCVWLCVVCYVCGEDKEPAGEL